MADQPASIKINTTLAAGSLYRIICQFIPLEVKRCLAANFNGCFLIYFIRNRSTGFSLAARQIRYCQEQPSHRRPRNGVCNTNLLTQRSITCDPNRSAIAIEMSISTTTVEIADDTSPGSTQHFVDTDLFLFVTDGEGNQPENADIRNDDGAGENQVMIRIFLSLSTASKPQMSLRH